MLVVALESPPGGGKGFLLKYLAAKGLHPLRCQVAMHDDAIHHIMDMNTDASRWALFTELYFLSVHVQRYRQARQEAAQQPNTVLVLEGSPVTDKLCYFEDQRNRERLHPLEAQLYDEWYAKLRPLWHIDHHLLLLSDMHAHMERIIDNAKVEQAGVGLEEVHAMTQAYVRSLPGAFVLPCPPFFEDNVPVLERLRATLVELLQALCQQHGT